MVSLLPLSLSSVGISDEDVAAVAAKAVLRCHQGGLV